MLSPAPRRFHLVSTKAGRARLQTPLVEDVRQVRVYLLDGPYEQRADRGSRTGDLLAAKMLVASDNQRLFSDQEAIGGCFDGFDNEAMEQIRGACRKLSGWDTDPDMAAIEETVKNSESGP